MSEWLSGNLGDIADIVMGQSPTGESVNTNGLGVPLLNGPTEFTIRYPKAVQFSTDPKRFSKVNDILFCVRGSTTGRMNWADQDYAIGRGLAAIRHKQGAEYRYFVKAILDYYLDTMLASASGSTFPNVSKDQLNDLEISYPPLSEQKAIASALSSLDDKIDLLHRQNKTLEAMAETLFRQWFIEEAKEDWEEVPLSEVAVIQNGYAFSSKDYVEKTVNEYEVLKMGHIDKNATLKLNPKRDYVPRKPELKRFVLNYNDIVMPMTDMKDNVVILGVPALVDANDKYVLNQRVARIYLKEDSKLSSIYYLFLQLKDPDFIARLQSTANSGVQVNLSTQAIKDCPIVIPSLEKQAEHRNTITGFYEQISNNRKQIQTLENLRDTLLPKLMSGEVRVQYQTEEVA